MLKSKLTERFSGKIPLFVAGCVKPPYCSNIFRINTKKLEGALRICDSVINPSSVRDSVSATAKLRTAIYKLEHNQERTEEYDHYFFILLSFEEKPRRHY